MISCSFLHYTAKMNVFLKKERAMENIFHECNDGLNIHAHNSKIGKRISYKIVYIILITTCPLFSIFLCFLFLLFITHSIFPSPFLFLFTKICFSSLFFPLLFTIFNIYIYIYQYFYFLFFLHPLPLPLFYPPFHYPLCFVFPSATQTFLFKTNSEVLASYLPFAGILISFVSPVTGVISPKTEQVSEK